jgi:hypothetical protein
MSTECTFIVLYIIFCAIDRIFAFFLARLKPVSSSLFQKQISARQALKLFCHPSQFGEWNSIMPIEKTLLSVGIFLNPGYVRASHATEQNWCIAYQTNNSINIRSVVNIMENLFFLVVAAILLAVSVYFLISYLKDRKKRS